jgi:hypothetical protein
MTEDLQDLLHKPPYTLERSIFSNKEKILGGEDTWRCNPLKYLMRSAALLAIYFDTH